jgi:transposase
MKQVPGRPKTDKADSDWISKLCMIGFILKSFVVGRKFRELREYTRYHKKLVQERSRQINRIEKLLQMNGFKLSSVLSDITGTSGLRLLKKLCSKGSVTLDEVITALDPRVRKKPEEIETAINGQMKMTSRLLLSRMLSKLAACDKEIEEIYGMMEVMSREHQKQIKQICSIPGLGELSAIYIIAEIGVDMSSFNTKSHIAAWAGLAPKDSVSAGKLKKSKTQKANIYIKSVLVECAWAATRTRNTRFSNWYWSSVKRLGEKKAITAVARKLLVCIYAMLKSGKMYDDSLDTADMERREALKLESASKIIAHQSRIVNTRKQLDNISQSSLINASVPRPFDSGGIQAEDASRAAEKPELVKKRGRSCKDTCADEKKGNKLT